MGKIDSTSKVKQSLGTTYDFLWCWNQVFNLVCVPIPTDASKSNFPFSKEPSWPWWKHWMQYRNRFWIADFRNLNRFWIRYQFGRQHPNLTSSSRPIWLVRKNWSNCWKNFCLCVCVSLSLKIQCNFWSDSDSGPNKCVLLLPHVEGLICLASETWTRIAVRTFWATHFGNHLASKWTQFLSYFEEENRPVPVWGELRTKQIELYLQHMQFFP